MSKEEMREGFEAWHCEQYKTKHTTGAPTRDLHNGVYSEKYCLPKQQALWECWQETGGDVAKVEALKEEIERIEDGAKPLMHIHPHVLEQIQGVRKVEPGGITYSGSKPVGGWTVPLFTRSDSAVIDRLKEGIAKHWKVICDQRAELEALRAQLADAAQSLETISRLAGRDEFMEDMTDVRGYANSRATVARSALSAIAEPADLESRPEERGCPELEPCSGCGTPGWTAACNKCIPY
jgi:hypothetical protein